MKTCTYVGQQGSELCGLPAIADFRWPWNTQGSICQHHLPYLRELAKQLACEQGLLVTLQAPPAPELSAEELWTAERHPFATPEEAYKAGVRAARGTAELERTERDTEPPGTNGSAHEETSP